ncbi:hypothetical protein COHA_002412 [Chlorella ohadii]|uniref:Cilia- and flagella-associated protein 157 n=1 Tax=Chlorella ohadii TaxID=2649997 RepID=A0AAD5H4R5_9CHLO|nr:hypothetical protein COHA_002412 [Chlorella ohadii]
MSTSAAAHTGLVELRSYQLKPEGIKEFMRLTNEKLELRKSLLPFLGMFTKEWQDDYLAFSRKCLITQESSIYTPAAGVLAAAGAVPLQHYSSPAKQGQPIYELRQYQLKPGYDGVPRLLAAFEKGIPHKVAADPVGQLVFFGSTEVGMLNNVIELWRYPSAQACHDARKASRAVPEWRETIAAAAAQALLQGEQAAAASQLSAERTQFGDLSSFLRHSLAEQTARADGLQRSLADALARLETAQASAAAAAAAAEERRAAEAAAAQAELDSQRQRLQQADTFLAERDQLVRRAQEAEAQLEEEKRRHHKLQMDRERKHASDRELWRRETAEAVQQAREEMAALTDQRLDATTKQTLIENEEMAGELQYQGRHVPSLLARNSALQKEVAELRVQLIISRRNEEELARKAVSCERAAESMVARMEALEAQRAAGEELADQLGAQLEAAREEARAAELRAAAEASRAEELQAALEAKTREMQRLQAERGDSAAFLLACLGDVRQQLLAQQGRAELGAIAEHVQQWEEEAEEAAAGCPGSPATCGGSRAAPAQHMAQLAQLPQQQREAVLLRLLEQLGVDWRAREGLLLPATSSSSSSGAAMSGAAAPAAERGSPSKLAQAVAANGKPGAAPSRPACLRSTSSVLSTGSKGACSRSELLELVQSEVRPWGGRSLSSSRVAAPAAAASHSGRRLGSVASDGSQ